MKSENPELRQFINNLSAKNKLLSGELRLLILNNLPNVIECVMDGALGYAPSSSVTFKIIYIAPKVNGVNLGLYYGAELATHYKIIKGNGKQMRHIKIKTSKDIQNPELKEIIIKAWQKADFFSMITKKKFD